MTSGGTERAVALVALAAVVFAGPAGAAGAGPGDRARSALGRVGVVEPGRTGAVTTAAGVEGGITEGLNRNDSTHERVAGYAAVAVDAARWLNFGGWIGGRYDLHPRDERGRDDGFLVESELSTRLSFRLGALGLGIEAAGWLPGGTDLGSSFSGLSADGRLLLSGHASDLILAGYAGYRLDRTAKAAGDPQRLRFGDRSALGMSDFNAMLAGIGAGYPVGRSLLYGEAAAQLLPGSSKLAASPIWVTLGVRRAFAAPGLSAELAVRALVSARPDASLDAPLIPIEPRAVLHFGISYRFGERPAPILSPAPPPAPPKPAQIAAAPVPPPATSVELQLLDDRGQPLARAEVVVTQPDGETLLVENEPGHYRLEAARPGRMHLRIKAEGFQPVERDIDVSAGKALRLDVRAEQALPAGQVRGLVRSMRGKPLSANVQLEPGGAQTKTDAEGFFQIDVPPGEYEVVIEAPGYDSQRRKAKVDEHGVVIVNADLLPRSGPQKSGAGSP
jgi:hypothetical protein